jgi:hypothetical protein
VAHLVSSLTFRYPSPGHAWPAHVVPHHTWAGHAVPSLVCRPSPYQTFTGTTSPQRAEPRLTTPAPGLPVVIPQAHASPHRGMTRQPSPGLTLTRLGRTSRLIHRTTEPARTGLPLTRLAPPGHTGPRPSHAGLTRALHAPAHSSSILASPYRSEPVVAPPDLRMPCLGTDLYADKSCTLKRPYGPPRPFPGR